MNAEILTVSELNRAARQLIERHFPLLWVSGEISNLTSAASGHLYFSLKDDRAQVRCVMFRSRAQSLPWRLENGQQVEAQALVTLYEARGEFQLNVEALRRAGLGRLYERFLQLRDKLGREGLLDASRKKPVPAYPRRVGIVTSPQAAALSDVLAAFARRARHVELIVYPTLVQGAEAPAAIVAALSTAYARAECDLLLLVRGGGSLEDLWAFNDETVARQIAAAPMPIIAGIGHETDTTIADLVADQRAATPTAAAELASAGWHAAARELATLVTTLQRTLRTALEGRMQAVDRLALRLIHPAQRLAAGRQRLESLGHRLHAAIERRLAQQSRLGSLEHRIRQAINERLSRCQKSLSRCQGALSGLSPLSTLARGYSIVRQVDGAIVRDASHLAPGERIELQFARGSASGRIETITPAGDL
ncbi:exodeoxyribonuclease VII large subunit [Sulfuricystis multivorans]|uniref:exodeoxyribonuclease VII large subunit n=1 Tax=Sulfuricystis multivorans TaxID=2211108 RepID=UPI0024DFEB25|nr:exodeoxyribonuclease VII large subunit [Sulfuricystis multivorans]